MNPPAGSVVGTIIAVVHGGGNRDWRPLYQSAL